MLPFSLQSRGSRSNYKLFALSQEVQMDDNGGYDPGKVVKKTCIYVV